MQHDQTTDECKLLLACDIVDTTHSIQTAIDTAYDNGFGLITYPLIDPKHDTPSLISTDNFLSNIPFAYHSNSRASIFQSIYGKISPWITFNPHNNSLTQKSIKLLQHQLDWSTHLGIFSIILPNPQTALHNYKLNTEQSEQKSNDDNNNNNNNNNNDIYLEIAINYASAIIQTCKHRIHMIGIVPITFDNIGWKIWKSLSILIRDIKNVRPALILGSDTPSKELIEQWFSEGVQVFILSDSIFLTNKKGFPVLSKAHQKVLLNFLKYSDCTIILRGKNNSLRKRYCQYLKHFNEKQCRLLDSEYNEKPFWDMLQTPLQPLSNNLEYVTYETFESDPIKYNQYEKAIIRALIDLDKDVKVKNNTQYILMVLGAGRGPLIDACINASKTTKIKIKLYAIEKNPHAIIILRNKNIYKWNGIVTIIEKDMREWNIKQGEKAHIIISELLGSFGDNELSPECLDGAIPKLLRKNGISIPYKYTSYLCPCTNNSVYNKLCEKPKDFEVPYVIHLKKYLLVSKTIEKCWEFIHSNEMKSQSNERYAKLIFKIDNNIIKNDGTIIHGFVGYFESVLYKDIIISIHPNNANKGMFSWFPIYFPLLKPINCKLNDEITICLWRKCNQKCMWYEWCVIKPILTQIHNASYRSYAVNLK